MYINTHAHTHTHTHTRRGEHAGGETWRRLGATSSKMSRPLKRQSMCNRARCVAFDTSCLTSAYVSIRQHTSACVSLRVRERALPHSTRPASRQHTSAYFSMRQHTSKRARFAAFDTSCLRSAYVSIHQHTSACV